MVDRILEIMKLKNLTPSQFADEIGIQRSGMSHLLSGRNKPSLEFVMKVLKRYPEVKADWLLHGATYSEVVLNSDAENPQTKEATLFKTAENVGVKPANPQIRMPLENKPNKKTEKIIIFYEDRSFREYLPE